MIVFLCPRCEAEISLEAGAPNQAVRCPTCLAPVMVPEALPPVRSSDVLGDALAGASAPVAAFASEESQPPASAVEPAGLTLNEDLPTVMNGESTFATGGLGASISQAVAQPLDEAFTQPRRKSPALAALLSLIPGFGHGYCGRAGRGFLYLIFQAAIIAMTVVAWQRVQFDSGYFGRKGLLAIGIISFVVIELLCIYDAARAAQRRNRELLLD